MSRRQELAYMEQRNDALERAERAERLLAAEQAAHAETKHAAAEVVDAVQAVQATSADELTEGPLVERVNRHMRAVTVCEEVLRKTFSERELERLTRILVDMHRDPLGDGLETVEGFLEDL